MQVREGKSHWPQARQLLVISQGNTPAPLKGGGASGSSLSFPPQPAAACVDGCAIKHSGLMGQRGDVWCAGLVRERVLESCSHRNALCFNSVGLLSGWRMFLP